MYRLALPFVLSCFASSVFAAETQRDLAVVEIVGHTLLDATGVPRSEVPSNVQTIGGEAAREHGATNLADALNNALGSVSVSNGVGNPYQNDINYRGYPATSLLGAPVGLSVYFDGLRLNEPFGANVNWDLIPMNAITGIDVLPGSNPMFGLNTLGGALVIRTKNGAEDSGVSAGVLGGSWGRRAVEVETGWVDRRHATDYFLSADVDAQTGYREHSASRVAQLYGKARWQGLEDLARLELSAGFADSRLSGTQSLPEDMLATPRAAYTSPDTVRTQAGFANFKANFRPSAATQLSGNLYFRALRAINVNSNAALDDGCFNDDGSLAASAAGGTTPYRCGDKAPGGTATNAVTSPAALALGYGRWGSSINTSLVESTTHEHTLGAALQGTQVSELAGHPNALYVGALADRSTIAYSQGSFLARLVDYGMVVTPNQIYGFPAAGTAPSLNSPPGFGGSNRLSSVALTATARNLALYFTDTYHLTQRLALTASGSFNQSSLDQAGVNSQYLNDDGGYSWTDGVSGLTYYNPGYVTAYKYANTAAGVATKPNGVPAGALPGPESNRLDGQHRYRRFNPAAGISYELGAAVQLFGSYSEAMRAPTSIELSCADPAHPCTLPTGFNGDPDLQPVVAKTVELGGRGRLLGGISWTAAAYRSRTRDDIQFIATSNTYGYFANVGDTERRGLELGAQRQGRRLFLSANYGAVQAVYRSAFVTARAEQVVVGNRIPGIPASSFKLRARYDLTPTLRAGATLILAGRQLSHGNESNADPEGYVGGHEVLNLDLNYQIRPDFRLTATLNNALDRRYSTYGLSGMRSIYTLVEQQFLTPAPPRALTVGITYSP